MFECFLLSSTEKKILKNAHEALGTLKDRMAGNPTVDSKIALAAGFLEHYRNAKEAGRKTGEVETHEFITARAFDLVGVIDGAFRDDVIRHSMDPDRELDLLAIAAEGHFYGPIDAAGSAYGNYMQRVYLPEVLDKIEAVHDIYENALTNFQAHYESCSAGPADAATLGIALHYLQDMTAPHHAGNYALFFSRYTDHFDTHLAFEKYARQLVNRHPDRFTADAADLRTGFAQRFDELGPREFAREINRMIHPFFPMIKKKDRTAWGDVIDAAVPIAIAASAVVLASALSGAKRTRSAGSGVKKKTAATRRSGRKTATTKRRR